MSEKFEDYRNVLVGDPSVHKGVKRLFQQLLITDLPSIHKFSQVFIEMTLITELIITNLPA